MPAHDKCRVCKRMDLDYRAPRNGRPKVFRLKDVRRFICELCLKVMRV